MTDLFLKKQKARKQLLKTAFWLKNSIAVNLNFFDLK